MFQIWGAGVCGVVASRSFGCEAVSFLGAWLSED